MVNQSHDRTGRWRWAGYAAVAWCILFGGIHLYWALGGTAGFEAWSMPSNKTLALTRDPVYMWITWGVVFVCAFGAAVALATVQAWGRRIPRWLLLSPLWIACGLCLVRGIGNRVQTLLILSGVLRFEPMAGPEAQAWYEWMLLDSTLFSPWFTLGGIVFGASAWLASRHSDDIESSKMVVAARQA